MVFNPFIYKSEIEIKNMIEHVWQDLEYLQKIKILLHAYPDLGITGIEAKGLDVLWNKISLEDKKTYYRDQWK